MSKAGIYDEVEIEDLDFDSQTGKFFYPCPCGDKFTITLEQIRMGEVIAECPSCSLTIRIIYDKDSYATYAAMLQSEQLAN